MPLGRTCHALCGCTCYRQGAYTFDKPLLTTVMGIAEKESPYSLRTQLYLSVQSASLVLDGPNDAQVRSTGPLSFTLFPLSQEVLKLVPAKVWTIPHVCCCSAGMGLPCCRQLTSQ